MPELTDDQRVVLGCLRASKEVGGRHSPQQIAMQHGWTLEKWEQMHAEFQRVEASRWRTVGEQQGGDVHRCKSIQIKNLVAIPILLLGDPLW